jgi:hypothetical protein
MKLASTPILVAALASLAAQAQPASLRLDDDGGELRRVALLIGNSAYGAEPLNLNSPPQDIQQLRGALAQDLGFEQVITYENLTRHQMVEAVLRAKETVGDGVLFFYYSGHAVSVDGQNYLIPIGANVKRFEDVPIESVSVSQVLGAFHDASLRVVVLDACRNNPFGFGAKGAGDIGLIRDRIDGVGGTLIGYAAAPGTVAYDGAPGQPSPYTSALVRWMREPGLDLPNLFIHVRGELAALTAEQPGGPQRSEEVSSLTPRDRFSFIAPIEVGGTKSEPSPVEPLPAPVPAPVEPERPSALADAARTAPWIATGAGVVGAVVGGTLLAVSSPPVLRYTDVFLQLTGDASVSEDDRRSLALEGNEAATEINGGLGAVFVAGAVLVGAGVFVAGVGAATGAGLWALSE